MKYSKFKIAGLVFLGVININFNNVSIRLNSYQCLLNNVLRRIRCNSAQIKDSHNIILEFKSLLEKLRPSIPFAKVSASLWADAFFGRDFDSAVYIAMESFKVLPSEYQKQVLTEIKKAVEIFEDNCEAMNSHKEFRSAILTDSIIFYIHSIAGIVYDELPLSFDLLLDKITYEPFQSRDHLLLFKHLGYLSIFIKTYKKFATDQQKQHLMETISQRFLMNEESEELLSQELLLPVDGLSAIPSTDISSAFISNLKSIIESLPEKIRRTINVVMSFFQTRQPDGKYPDGMASDISFDGIALIGTTGETGDMEQIFIHELGHLIHKDSGLGIWRQFKQLFRESKTDEDFLESHNPQNPEHYRINFMEDFANSFSRYYFDTEKAYQEMKEKGSDVVKEKFKIITSLFSFKQDGRRYVYVYKVIPPKLFQKTLTVKRTAVLIDEEGLPGIPAEIPEEEWEVFKYPEGSNF